MRMAKVKETNSRSLAADEERLAPAAADPVSDEDWKVLQHEVSRYIASMTVEMANMARSAKLDLLVYFLDMAHVEASTQAEQTDH